MVTINNIFFKNTISAVNNSNFNFLVITKIIAEAMNTLIILILKKYLPEIFNDLFRNTPWRKEFTSIDTEVPRARTLKP